MNQSPPTEKQTGKRIVSKGAYVKAHLRQKGLGAIGYLTIVVFGTSLIIVPLLVLIFVTMRLNDFAAVSSLPLCVAFCVWAWHIGKKGEGLVHRAAQIDPGVPLTRANTADLPSQDSLVRASAEPVQEQDTVLLRAATASMERHEEQLVRAAGEAK